MGHVGQESDVFTNVNLSMVLTKQPLYGDYSTNPALLEFIRYLTT